MTNAEIRERFRLHEGSAEARVAHLEHVFEGYTARVSGGTNPYSPGSARAESWADGFAEACWALADPAAREFWCSFARFGHAACGVCVCCRAARRRSGWSPDGRHA